MAERDGVSAMARETAEIPAAAGRLLARTDRLAAIVGRIEQAKPRIVVLCGRGSLGHVGVYLRYLFETRLGLLASAAALSVVTCVYRKLSFGRIGGATHRGAHETQCVRSAESVGLSAHLCSRNDVSASHCNSVI